MEKIKYIRFIVIALILSFCLAVVYKFLQSGNPLSYEVILFGSVVFLHIITTGIIAYYFYTRLTKQDTTIIKRKLGLYYLLFVLISIAISQILVSAGVYIYYLLMHINTENFIHNLFSNELPFALKQIIVWIMLGSVVFFYVIWTKAVEREQKLKVENLNYKYNNLKAQVNPHFLFNSLNTLSELIYQDSQKAEKYVHDLAAIYRYVIEHEDVMMVSLKSEIQFVSQYLHLLRDRTNGKLFLDISIDKKNGYQIIPVSIQTLIENAIKHNTMSKENPLFIKISEGKNFIQVSNNIQRKELAKVSTQRGLANLNERVKLATGKELEVIDDEYTFTVRIPLII